MTKQPTSAPTASTIGPCPTMIQISMTSRHGTEKFSSTFTPPYNPLIHTDKPWYTYYMTLENSVHIDQNAFKSLHFVPFPLQEFFFYTIFLRKHVCQHYNIILILKNSPALINSPCLFPKNVILTCMNSCLLL